MARMVTIEKANGTLAEVHASTARALGYADPGDGGAWTKDRRPPQWQEVMPHHEYLTTNDPPSEQPAGEQEDDPDALAEGNTIQED